MNFLKYRPSEGALKNPLVATAFKGLCFIGLILTSGQSTKHFVKACLSYALLSTFTFLEFWHAATLEETALVTTYGAIGFCLFSGGIRLIDFFILKPREFFELITDLDADITKSKANATPQENEIIRECHTYARRLSLFLLKSSQVSCIFLIIFQLWQSNFNPIKTLGATGIPPLIRNRWPYDKLPFSMYLVNLYNIAAIYVGSIALPSMHALMSVMTTFVVMNLRLLNHQLEHLHDYVTEKGILKRNAQAYNLLVGHIKTHRHIKEYVDRIQNLGGKFLFIDFVLYSLQLCFMLYQLVTVKDVATLLFTINYVSTLVAILWLYYYHGNEIIYHSNLISQSIYLSNWYEFDLKFRKAMLQLMTSSYEPMKMYAGIIEVNIPNFIGIVKAGYSYMTILRQWSN